MKSEQHHYNLRPSLLYTISLSLSFHRGSQGGKTVTVTLREENVRLEKASKHLSHGWPGQSEDDVTALHSLCSRGKLVKRCACTMSTARPLTCLSSSSPASSVHYRPQLCPVPQRAVRQHLINTWDNRSLKFPFNQWVQSSNQGLDWMNQNQHGAQWERSAFNQYWSECCFHL